VLAESSEIVGISHPLMATTVAPVAVTATTASPLITAGAATIVDASPSAVLALTTSTRPVTVINDGFPVIAKEDILITITRNTTAAQLEEFKKQMKEKGFDLNIDKTTYSNAGMLTHITGKIKSQEEESANFSATDFEKVILARVKEDSHTYFRIEIIDRKKVVI